MSNFFVVKKFILKLSDLLVNVKSTVKKFVIFCGLLRKNEIHSKEFKNWLSVVKAIVVQ